MKETKTLSDIYGILVKDVKYAITIDKGYIYISDLNNVYINTASCLESKIIYTNNPNACLDIVIIGYSFLLDIIKQDYAEIVKSGVINLTCLNKEEILDKLSLYKLYVMQGKGIGDHKINIDSLNNNVSDNQFYAEIKDGNIRHVDNFKVSHIFECLKRL